MPFDFEVASNAFSNKISRDDRVFHFGNNFIQDQNFELIDVIGKGLLHNYPDKGKLSEDKFKIRQGYWFLDECSDQMVFLKTLLKGIAGNESHILRNMGILVTKSLAKHGIKQASAFLSGTFAALTVGPLAVPLAMKLGGMAGERSYKNFERGFAKKHPSFKLKGLYPSTKNIEDSLRKAYFQEGMRSYKSSEGYQDIAKFAIKHASVMNNTAKEILSPITSTILPAWDLTGIAYSVFQIVNGLTQEKITLINNLMDAIERVAQAETNGILTIFANLGEEESSMDQSDSMTLLMHMQFKNKDTFSITPEKIASSYTSILRDIDLNRKMLSKLSADTDLHRNYPYNPQQIE